MDFIFSVKQYGPNGVLVMKFDNRKRSYGEDTQI